MDVVATWPVGGLVRAGGGSSGWLAVIFRILTLSENFVSARTYPTAPAFTSTNDRTSWSDAFTVVGSFRRAAICFSRYSCLHQGHRLVVGRTEFFCCRARPRSFNSACNRRHLGATEGERRQTSSAVLSYALCVEAAVTMNRRLER